jgi:DNA-binding transcriptional ArsR family regulator
VNFRQRRGLRVRSARQALEFVDTVGLCSTFHTFPEGLPSLWEAVVGRARPRWPRRSHHDAGIGLTWNLKDELPSHRQVYYGKLIKGRPVLVALDLFPAFYALVRGSQRARDYGREYQAGRLSQQAKRIMDSLMRESPQYTRSLRAECFMLEPSRTREFERAMAELQQGLWIVKTEERYEPSFSYRWDLLERWLPKEAAAGRRLRRRAALDRLLARYLRAAVYSTPAVLARLFSVPRSEVEAALARLDRAGVVETAVEIEGERGRWVVSV